jgi:hypothetical protein
MRRRQVLKPLPLLMLALTLASPAWVGAAPAFSKGRLLFADDFSQGLDRSVWITEIAPLPDSSVYVQDGKLVLDTRGGVTVWLNRKLRGNILIEYKRRVLMQGGARDRLSDLNQFWMASDPRRGEPFGRDGGFESYDDLRLYYVGMGGNSNTSTRLRKYTGNGERPVLQEHGDARHLLQANQEYLVQTLVKDGRTAFYVDGVEYFSFTDPEPLREGYFGLRSTWSRQEVGAVRVYEVE